MAYYLVEVTGYFARDEHGVPPAPSGLLVQLVLQGTDAAEAGASASIAALDLLRRHPALATDVARIIEWQAYIDREVAQDHEIDRRFAGPQYVTLSEPEAWSAADDSS